ncbi:MAG: electron transfer flavoprotein subunit alpha/FixB family protein [candidate division WOR-3 bacterium]|nr:MAG: electron transfer flavoprotein subunit alpha/FixB family protein [candidate division WOR-3 bacterium]
MATILAVIEHRQGVIRDITFELLTLGRKLVEKNNAQLTGVLLGHDTQSLAESLRTHVHRLLVVDHEVFSDFNGETYQQALTAIIKKENPFLTLVGNTAFGIDFCPSLATQLGVPFTTDCIGVEMVDGRIRVTRQLYDGKMDAHVQLAESSSYVLTVRSGICPAEQGNLSAEIQKIESPVVSQPDYKKFIEYIEAVVGDVDITKADVVVGVGRGIKEQANLPLVEDFAKAIGGVVACSRPIVDANWLPKDRQVGSSGKTVKPKLYIAIGISGAFQHIAGMKNSDTIIAINKDSNAPIFNEADYGIVDDLFKVLPALKSKILEIKK